MERIAPVLNGGLASDQQNMELIWHFGLWRGGRYGIRTHGDPEATTAFEAAPFVRSGNLPPQRLPALRLRRTVNLGHRHKLDSVPVEGSPRRVHRR